MVNLRILADKVFFGETGPESLIRHRGSHFHLITPGFYCRYFSVLGDVPIDNEMAVMNSSILRSTNSTGTYRDRISPPIRKLSYWSLEPVVKVRISASLRYKPAVI